MAEKLETSFCRLKEGGATLNAIVNNLSEGVLATDLSGNIIFINLAARHAGARQRGSTRRATEPLEGL